MQFSRRWILFYAVLCLAVRAAGGASALTVEVRDVPPAGLPASLVGELAAVLAEPGEAPDPAIRYVVEGPGGRCESQSSDEGGGFVRLAWHPSGPGLHRIVVAQDAADGLETGRTAIARVAGSGIRIDNGVLTAMHAPGRAGGFPSEVTLAGGTHPLAIEYADRVYEPEAGQFFLTVSTNSAIRLVANGPLFATVEVEGKYTRMAEGRLSEHPSAPRARYRFTYHRDSPLVRVDVVVTQAAAFAWKELHILEVRAAAAGLGKGAGSSSNAVPVRALRWSGGEPALSSNVTHAGGSQRFSRWAALSMENGTVGVINPHAADRDDLRARIHDGEGLLYVMGPWVEFAVPRVEFERYLYFGPGSARET